MALTFLKGGWHYTGLLFSVFIHNLLPRSTTVWFILPPHHQRVSAKMTTFILFARILVSRGFLHSASSQARVYSDDSVDSSVQVGTKQVFAEVSCSAGYSFLFHCFRYLCTSLHTFQNTTYIIHSFSSPFTLHLPGCFSSLGSWIPLLQSFQVVRYLLPPHLSKVHLLTNPSLKQLCSIPAHLTAQLETTSLGFSPARGLIPPTESHGRIF